jgi:hypothetical protein
VGDRHFVNLVLNEKSATEANKDNEEFATIYIGIYNSAAQKASIGLVEEICRAPLIGRPHCFQL